MSRGALFTTPLEFYLGASWCAGVIALLKSQSLCLYVCMYVCIFMFICTYIINNKGSDYAQMLSCTFTVNPKHTPAK